MQQWKLEVKPGYWRKEEQRSEATQMKFLRHLLGITKLGKGMNQCIRKKERTQIIVKEINLFKKQWLQHVQKMHQTEYHNKQYNINQNVEGTLEDPRRDGRTNFILRIKEQETRPKIHDYEDNKREIYPLSTAFHESPQYKS